MRLIAHLHILGQGRARSFAAPINMLK
jgi:hypothetical protein